MTVSLNDHFACGVRRFRPPAGSAGATLNLIRAATMRNAVDLAAFSELVSNPALRVDLSRHAAKAARNGDVILRRMTELDFLPFRPPAELDRVDALLARCRARDVRDVYAARGTVADADAMELLVARSILQRAAIAEVRASCDALEGDAPTREVLGLLVCDGAQWLATLEEWLRWFGRRFSPRAVTVARERLERIFCEVDLAYREALPAYFARRDVARVVTVPMAYAVGQ